LPDDLAPLMAKGYRGTSDTPPLAFFETVAAPAGGFRRPGRTWAVHPRADERRRAGRRTHSSHAARRDNGAKQLDACRIP